ncbi:MAG TPA: nitroreductase/quinone reductase family protein [Thermoleophilaceae bacterium]|nr:nitroreductase/quinone reductase family protein [Thermoleophilaceae bacterium]
MTKRRWSTFLTAKLVNPIVRAAARAGIPLPVVVILETRGRKSGRPRRIPVGKAITGDTLWVIAEHGRKAAYVKNIEADPHVRVKVGRRWRSGTARVLYDDDWRERQRRLPNKLNSAAVRLVGTEHLTIRIDLGPAGAPPPAGPAPS